MVNRWLIFLPNHKRGTPLRFNTICRIYGPAPFRLAEIVMARTDNEVVTILREIYNSEFGGKERQRYLISRTDLRSIYGLTKLFDSRVQALTEAAFKRKLYLIDLGEGANGRIIAVIRVNTVDRWRRAPKKIIDDYRNLVTDDEGDDEDDEE